MGPYDFSNLKLSSPDISALEQLANINLCLKEHLSSAFELPELGFKLDLESRTSSEVRQLKHIHQMCLLHAHHFEFATKIKVVYILDSYLWAVSQLNPIATYSSARSLMELHLVTRFVEHLLDDARTGPRTEWQKRGQKFFDVILQSRYGTSDSAAQQLLLAHGYPDSALQPFRISKASKFVARELSWINEHYALLCDCVHPNMSSQRTTAAYSGESSVARHSGGGLIILTKPAPLLHYQFPMPEPGRKAVSQTAERALDSTRELRGALNRMARSPFSKEELTDMTGSSMGMTFASPVAVSPAPQVGRNELCPCGSGKKYKKCHANAPLN